MENNDKLKIIGERIPIHKRKKRKKNKIKSKSLKKYKRQSPGENLNLET